MGLVTTTARAMSVFFLLIIASWVLARELTFKSTSQAFQDLATNWDIYPQERCTLGCFPRCFVNWLFCSILWLNFKAEAFYPSVLMTFKLPLNSKSGSFQVLNLVGPGQELPSKASPHSEMYHSFSVIFITYAQNILYMLHHGLKL